VASVPLQPANADWRNPRAIDLAHTLGWAIVVDSTSNVVLEPQGFSTNPSVARDQSPSRAIDQVTAMRASTTFKGGLETGQQKARERIVDTIRVLATMGDSLVWDKVSGKSLADCFESVCIDLSLHAGERL
jgi:hypothetical protein